MKKNLYSWNKKADMLNISCTVYADSTEASSKSHPVCYFQEIYKSVLKSYGTSKSIGKSFED